MKKTILIVLMVVIIATPCFAQEIETDGLFSIDGTLWQALPIGMSIFPIPWIWTTDDLQFGFDDGQVYPDLEFDDYYFYMDMLVFSLFSTRNSISTNQGPAGGDSTHYFGILQPIGIGMVVEAADVSPYPPIISIALLIKTDDNWTPPEVE